MIQFKGGIKMKEVRKVGRYYYLVSESEIKKFRTLKEVQAHCVNNNIEAFFVKLDKSGNEVIKYMTVPRIM